MKKHIVRLSAEERLDLQHVINKLKGSSQKVRRAQILLKTDAEAWKDKFFKQHPDADTYKDGVLSWPEYRAHKAKLDAEKAKKKIQP